MPYDASLIKQIAAKYRLYGEPRLLPNSGMVNEAWALGDAFIVRIVRDPECDVEPRREEVAVPLARSAGVRSPELLAVDFDNDIVERPFTIYRRAEGVLLGELEIDPASIPDLYRELGREFALMHLVDVPDHVKELLNKPKKPNAEKGLAACVEKGLISQEERDDIAAWCDHLETHFSPSKDGSFIHQDVHPWNMFVDPVTYDLTAIIDWGDAGYGPVNIEFASMPLVGMISMLEGYREVGGTVDQRDIAETLYNGIILMNWEIRGLDPAIYMRRWWRTPLGGWEETKSYIREHFPELALPSYAAR